MNANSATMTKTIACACFGMCIVLTAGGASSLGAVENTDKKETTADKTQNKPQKNIKQIIFEEQKIEGKLRRPQMVLIKADERPNFPSMVLTNLGKNANIAEFVDPSVIEKTPNQGAFQFEENRISNLIK